MKIAFFTEMGFYGKVPRDHDNMRTEFAWMVALDATHIPLTSNFTNNTQFDIGIIIVPKNNPRIVNIPNIRKICNKIGMMQEGPHWYYQDKTVLEQVEYYNLLHDMDFVFAHNQSDVPYFTGICDAPVFVMPTLMIDSATGELESVDRNGIIIGGNFVSWYGGFDSFIVASELGEDVYAPSMGRKKEGEETYIKHLPYMKHRDWIHALNKFKYGIHLMRTHAAGTFALNCSYLGIPCIGYYGLDTQQRLHPNLTVDLGDLVSAKNLLKLLRDDEQFYTECSIETKKLYKELYYEDKFYTAVKEQLALLEMEL